MRYNQRPPNFAVPTLSPTVRNILLGAVGLFVLELFVNLSQPGLTQQLAWLPFGHGFQWYQPLTRYFVQGSDPLSFLLALLVLYFFLPLLLTGVKRGSILPILGSVFLGALVLGLASDSLGLLRIHPARPSASAAWGWTTLSTVCVALFGLLRPKATVNLFFVLPVQAGLFAWGTGLISLLFFLYSPNLGTAQHLGSWLGLMVWWFGTGPGSRGRKLKAKGRKVEKDLKRFKVLEGGQNQDNKGDWVN